MGLTTNITNVNYTNNIIKEAVVKEDTKKNNTKKESTTEKIAILNLSNNLNLKEAEKIQINRIHNLISLLSSQITFQESNVEHKKLILDSLSQKVSIIKTNNLELEEIIKEENKEEENKQQIIQTLIRQQSKHKSEANLNNKLGNIKFNSINIIKSNEKKIKNLNSQIKKMDIKTLKLDLNEPEEDEVLQQVQIMKHSQLAKTVKARNPTQSSSQQNQNNNPNLNTLNSAKKVNNTSINLNDLSEMNNNNNNNNNYQYNYYKFNKDNNQTEANWDVSVINTQHD